MYLLPRARSSPPVFEDEFVVEEEEDAEVDGGTLPFFRLRAFEMKSDNIILWNGMKVGGEEEVV